MWGIAGNPRDTMRIEIRFGVSVGQEGSMAKHYHIIFQDRFPSIKIRHHGMQPLIVDDNVQKSV